MEQKIIGYLTAKVPGLNGICLFGSQADGSARPDSDVDIAILLEHEARLNSSDLFELKMDLSELLGLPVDLIDLQSAHTDLRYVVLNSAKRIFCKDAYFCDFFEMTAFSMYQNLEVERKEIIEEVKKRGTIYG